MKRILLLLAMLAVTLHLSAQEYMGLVNDRNGKRIKFASGDMVTFKKKGDDILYTDQISAVFDTAVAFGNHLVKYEEFDKVWIFSPSAGGRILNKVSSRVGLLFFGIDTFNRLINHNYPVVSQTAIIVLGTAFGIKGLIRLTQKRWFRTGGHRHVKYIDLRPVLP